MSQHQPMLSLDEDMVSAAMRAAFAARSPASRKDGPVLALDPDNVQHDLARLVLTLVEFLRRLLEMQAVRRMENGTLDEDEEERIGLTLMQARERIVELAESFGLKAEELSLDLGPLGKLM
jgi:Gas vesicle protein K